MGLSDVEPIYCAEQIAVPPDMADILKAYTKEVIRRQPEDIISVLSQLYLAKTDARRKLGGTCMQEFSAVYFSNLAAATKALKQFEAPSQQALRAMNSICGKDPLDKSRLMEVGVQCGVAKETLTKVFSLERFAEQDMVMPREIVVLLLTMAGANLKDALAGIFAVFGADDGYLDATDFIELFDFLAFLDQGTEIPEELRQEVTTSFRELPPITLGSVYSHPAFANM